MRTSFALVLSIVVIVFVGCGGGSGGGGNGSTGASGQVFLAIGSVDSNGGTIEVTDPNSPLYRTAVIVPAGVFTQSTQLTIKNTPLKTFQGDSLRVEIKSSTGQQPSGSLKLRLRYDKGFERDYSIDPNDFIVTTESASGDTSIITASTVDSGRQEVTVDVDHLSFFEVTSALIRVLSQQRRLIDETLESYTVVSMKVPKMTIVLLEQSKNSQQAQFGKGKKSDLKVGGKNILLLIHGFTGTPATFLLDGQGQIDHNRLLWVLKNDPAFKDLYDQYDVILLAMYPSGAAVSDNGEWLANEIQNICGPNTVMDVIPFSMGNLVLRYALETKGMPFVRRIVMIGAPNNGGLASDMSAFFFGPLIGISTILAIPGAENLQQQSTFYFINNRFPDKKGNALYFPLSGDIGGGQDGWVRNQSSGNSFHLIPPEEAVVYQGVEHNSLLSDRRLLIGIRSILTKPNAVPTANAGVDRIITLGSPVILDGSQSADPDKDAITYAWTQTNGATVTLSNTTTVTATFTPTQIGVYTFTLTVSDTDKTGTDTVTITVNPLPFTNVTVVLTDDTYIESTYTKQPNNYGGLTEFLAGPTGPQSIFTYQTFLRFEVQSAIPAGATILSATLTCTSLVSVSAPATVDCYETGTVWSESFLTWNVRYGNALQGTPGPSLGKLTIIGTTGTFDATSYFQTQAATGIATGTAFSFAFDRAYGNSAVSFAAKEGTATRPTLTITWK